MKKLFGLLFALIFLFVISQSSGVGILGGGSWSATAPSGNDSYTKSLLHVNSDYTDSAAGGTHTWTGYGTVQIDITVKKFGAGSLLMDGDSDYIDTPDSTDWTMGLGDFTVDLWVKRARYPMHEMMIGQADASGNNSTCSFTCYFYCAEDKFKTILHMDGADLSTTFLDSGRWNGNARIWTAHDGAKLSTTSPKFGSACAVFDGTLDRIDTPDHVDWTMGTGDFTIDFWMKRGNIGVAQYIFGQCNSLGQTATISFYGSIGVDNKITVVIINGSTPYAAVSTGTIADTTIWHHIAMVRHGNNLNLYIDGTQDGTVDVTGKSPNDSANKLAVGSLGEYTTATFNGRIDEFRVCKGEALWTSNFTVPSAAYVYDRIMFGVCSGATGYGVLSSADVSDANWHHIAGVRYGNNLYTFLDGILVSSSSVAGISVNDSTNKLAIGREGELNGFYFKGNIDEVRISKGIARWTSNFTPPIAEYGP